MIIGALCTKKDLYASISQQIKLKFCQIEHSILFYFFLIFVYSLKMFEIHSFYILDSEKIIFLVKC